MKIPIKIVPKVGQRGRRKSRRRRDLLPAIGGDRAHAIAPRIGASHRSIIISGIVFMSIFMILLNLVSCVVVYQVRYIASRSGRTDYALAGDSIELTCHYMMKDEAEDIKQLVWSKDGRNFLKWRKNVPGLEVLDYTFKGHIDPSSKSSHLIVHNVTIDMHGKYKCSIKTDLNTHEMEQQLVVISQSSCKLNDWRVTSQPNDCRETFRLDCRNMFPKPEPSCGLWNGKVDKFIRSVMLDISEEANNNKTYRIKYNDKFELPTSSEPPNGTQNSDLLHYPGHLIFKCDISVPETSWRLSLIHRMFDYNDGCLQEPLESIERMRHNYSHYAAMRIHQDQYLLTSAGDIKPSENSLDSVQARDFEILSNSNAIKYELLSASTEHPAELNCWRKPRIGSIAKLSCDSKPSNHVKLMGAHLLQCQQGAGWVPLVDSVKPANSRFRIKGPRSSRRASQADNGDDSGEQTQQLPGSKELQDKDQNHNDDNDDDDHDDDSATDRQAEVSSKPPDGSIVIIPRSRLEEPASSNFLPGNQQQQSDLSPAQLASLIPSCVSTRRHYKLEPTLNRLPLRDESLIHPGDSAQHRKGHRMGATGGSHVRHLHSSSGCLRSNYYLIQYQKYQILLLAALTTLITSTSCLSAMPSLPQQTNSYSHDFIVTID